METRVKRVLAMLMVFALSVGLLPAGIFANPATATHVETTLTATITRTDSKTTSGEATPDEATPDEATPDEPMSYTYTITLKDRKTNEELPVEEADIQWYVVDGERIQEEGPVLVTDDTAVRAVVKYDGISMTLVTDEDGEAELTVEHADVDFPKTVTVGVPFEMPSEALVDGVKLVDPQGTVIYDESVRGATADQASPDEVVKTQYLLKLSFVPKDGYEGGLKEIDGKYYATVPGTITLEQFWRGTDGEVTYCSRKLTTEAKYPTASFYIGDQLQGDETAKLTEKTTVTLKVTDAKGLVDVSYLPSVSPAGTWVNDGNVQTMTFADLSDVTEIVYGQGDDAKKLMVYVDVLEPEISITKTPVDEAVATVDEIGYYDHEFVYSIQVTDKHLDTATVHYVLDGEENNVELNVKDGKATHTIALKNGQQISELKVSAKDTYGLAKEQILGNHIIDMDDPTAELTFSDNVVDFYLEENPNETDKIYLILEDPVVGESGTAVDGEDQEVTVTFTATDRNFADGDVPNQESTITFTETLVVPTDSKMGVRLNLTVTDLANNILQPFTTQIGSRDHELNIVNGLIDYEIIVDRRRPGSEDKDDVVPTISVTTTADPVKTVNGKDYFDQGFKFDVAVSDFESGLQNVEWSLSDKDEYKAVVDRSNTYGDASGRYEIDVTPTNSEGVESDAVTLKVNAKDNVHNTTTYEKVFAVDTLAPRLTVVEHNAEYANGYFLRDSQSITITVTDLNFDPDASALVWTYNGNVVEEKNSQWVVVEGEANTWSLTQEFSADGDYSWNVTVADYANHKVEQSGVFVIDTKDPTVNVEISSEDTEANTHQHTEDYVVDYYSKDVTVKIEITDVNLDRTFNGNACAPVATVEYKLQGDEQWRACEVTAADEARSEETLTAEFTLKDGDMLVDMRIIVKDNAGNTPAAIEHFEESSEGVWEMAFNPIVADTTAPTAKLSFSENVVGFYEDKEAKVLYLILDPTVTGASGEQAVGDQSVEVIFETSDRNIKLNAGVSGDHFLPAETEINTESMLVYRYVTDAIAADGYAEFVLDLSVVDLAGNPIEAFNCEPTKSNVTFEFVPVNNGTINRKIAVDRQRPISNEDDDLPTIEVTTDKDHVKTKDGKEIYNEAFEFNIKVFDQHSGLREVNWSLTDGNNAVEKKYNLPDNAEGEFTVAVLPKNGAAVESDTVKLWIEAIDHVGNTITYEKVFILDTLKPRVKIEPTNTDVKNDKFFNNDQTFTIEVTDLTFDAAIENSYVDVNGVKDNAWEDLGNHTWQRVLEFTEDGDYTFAMQAKDLAGYAWDPDYSTLQGELLDGVLHFTIDKTPPTLKVEFSCDDDTPNTMDGVDYYSETVKIDITIGDVNLGTDGGDVWIKYSLKDPRVEDETWTDMTLEFSAELREYQEVTKTIEIGNGQVLRNLQIYVIDSATNQPAAPEGFAYGDDGIIQYSCNAIAVDTEAPVITVEKQVEPGKQFIQTHDSVDYYNGDVTFKFTIQDKFLFLSDRNEARIGDAQLVIKYQDREETVDLMLQNHSQEGEADQYWYEYTVVDATMVESMTLTIYDNAGNYVSETQDNLTVQDADKLTGFTVGGNVWTYTGNPLVVDSTAPTATLRFSDNVIGLYENGNVVYVILKTPTNGSSAVAAPQNSETVKIYFETRDKNLALNNGVSGAYSWVENCAVNTDSTLSFTYVTNAIPTDNTNVFALDLTVIDLAGNPLQSFNSDPVADDIAMPVVIDNTGANKGKIDYQISVDRRRPTSLDPTNPALPTIEVTHNLPNGEEPVRTAPNKGDLELFNKSFDFILKINDGVLNENNSGVQYVKWTLTDPNGAIVTGEKEYNRTRGDNSDIIIPVTVVDRKESNEVTLTITAIDNVGNTITYVKNFAVDKKAPEVSFEQQDASALNTNYFKADQTITIKVKDLNFDVDVANSFVNDTRVNPGVKIGDWKTTDNMEYTISVTYNKDGRYTYSAQVKDLAGNTWTPNYSTLTGEQKADGLFFIIDKTAPKISINYKQRNDYLDVGNVRYFNDDLEFTVNIEETNFEGKDVEVKLNGQASNFLGTWPNAGDTHRVTKKFDECNEHYFSVTYTDKAGNKAVVNVANDDLLQCKANDNTLTSGKFTVDKVAPSIAVATESMKGNSVHIVPENLVLDFVVNDPQGNLSPNVIFEVKFVGIDFNPVTLNNPNEYFEVTVSGTEGSIKMKDIAHVPENDGVYFVNITVSDHSGNQVALDPQVVFSLNRFGSTFACDQDTYDFLKADKGADATYRDVGRSLVIYEYNPNTVKPNAAAEVQGALITLSVNGKTITLEKDVHYVVEAEAKVNDPENAWTKYTYTILEETFKDAQGDWADGEYTILFYSEDAAGRKNSNEANGELVTAITGIKPCGKINFHLDSTLPEATVIGLEDGEQYKEENKKVQIDITDSTGVTMVIMLGDKVIPEQMNEADRKDGESWYYYDVEAGHWILNIAETDQYEKLEIQLTDSANNSKKFPFNIQVTENLWELYIANPIALISTAVGAVALIVLIVVLISKRKKKKAAAAG